MTPRGRGDANLIPTKSPRKTRAAVAAVCVGLALLAASGAAYLFYKRKAARPVPTVAGWRARVSTHAGDGAPGVVDHPSGSHAQFADPFGVAADAAGNIYVADGGASNRIRKIAPDGSVSTLAGDREGYADGAGAGASFHTPSGLAIDREGNLYVADTGNNRIRKVTPAGIVTTIAGDGTAGFRDGPGGSAQFDGPVGVSVDASGQVYVADTYNDRIRVVSASGEVRTLAGGDRPGYVDGDGRGGALFDTPCGVAVSAGGDIYVADTGNDRLRKVGADAQVSTVGLYTPEGAEIFIGGPVGMVTTRDGFLYFTEQERGIVWQLGPDGRTRLIAGVGTGFADGDGASVARMNQPAGLTLDREGRLYVADGVNYLVRKLAPADTAPTPDAATPPVTSAQAPPVEIPRLGAATLGGGELPWPLDPQNRWHEVTATLGEVRGSYDSPDPRHHLHSGIDVFGALGATVRAIHEEKVTSPAANWGFDALHEGMRAGLFAYIHMRVGRDGDGKMFDDSRFRAVTDEAGKITRVRVRRGTRFRVGDALGTVNRMYHVHLNFGPPHNELNPLILPFAGFTDGRAPLIARDGVQLFDQLNIQLSERRDGRLIVRGTVRVVVEAYDQVDGNAARRRIGLHRLGYQILKSDGTPAEGFAAARVNLEFDRLPPLQDAVKLAYADQSGITVYGSAETRFFYEVTNRVGRGEAREGRFDAGELPPGDYTLRVFAADFANNVTTDDLKIRIVRD